MRMRKQLFSLFGMGACVCGGVGLGLGVSGTKLDPRVRVDLITRANAANQLSIPQPPGGGLISGSRASEIMKFGYPGFDNVRTFEDFVLSYDRKTRIPHWVYEHLTPDRMTYDPSVDRSKCSFREDTSVHPFFQSRNADYKKSGYDRGHIAAAGNHRRTQNSVDQTFLLSNMAPQIGPGMNRGKWNDLEKYVRKLARKYPNVWICSGPLFLPRPHGNGRLYVTYEVIGDQHVAVPTHFFKVILVDLGGGKWDLESFVLPNQSIPDQADIKQFYVPLEVIERSAGFLIFDKLPRKSVRFINGKSS